MLREDDYAIQAVRAGAKGYLPKSARSEEVIRAVRLAAGYNNRQIASELSLAESTVKNSLSALFQKIGVRDRTQAVLFAFAENLVTRPMSQAS